MTDLTGKQFRKLTVKDYDPKTGKWLCRCKCGTCLLVPAGYLLSGVTASCGCSKGRALDLTGQRFGSLTVLEPVQKRAADESIRWLCRCDCGEYVTVSSNKLRTGHTKSCGCQKIAACNAAKTFVDGTCVEILLSDKVRTDNTSGRTGVARKRRKWQAYMTYAGKTRWLGVHDSKEEAVQAREEAEETVKTHLSELLQTEVS